MIRCRECDHSNPDDHRFCAMCGAKLEPATKPLDIDDDDPLELETPVYHFEDRSRLHERAQNLRDRQREEVRDTSSINSNGGRGSRPVTNVETFPHEIVEPRGESEYGNGNSSEQVSGIGGPSFLGLNYESGSNRGFVYDKPRQDGFVYDTDGESPEYLLDEVPRGVSWRAWALCLLLIIGGGLGYIQWRASHHQGPDLASILARNGPTVNPTGPVIPDKSAKPADKANTASNTNSDVASAKGNSQSENSGASTSADSDNAEGSSVIDSNASAAKPGDTKTEAAKTANTKTGDTETGDMKAAKAGSANSEDNADESLKAAASTSPSRNTDEDEHAAKPESDGPEAKTAKAARRTEVADEEPPQPKILGEKDPLIIQADKYIQGRGVRKNCSTGINLLRQAVSEGNPAASVKLGALYWSGTCVTQSKVTAYRWFSRAHSLEPTNRWVERSRNSLWASMSPQEQRKTSY